MIVGGLSALIIGGRIFVDSATAIARGIGYDTGVFFMSPALIPSFSSRLNFLFTE